MEPSLVRNLTHVLDLFGLLPWTVKRRLFDGRHYGNISYRQVGSATLTERECRRGAFESRWPLAAISCAARAACGMSISGTDVAAWLMRWAPSFIALRILVCSVVATRWQQEPP